MVETPLGNCESSGTPCWRLVANPSDCSVSGLEIKIDRGGAPAPANTLAAVRCATCANPDDPHCR